MKNLAAALFLSLVWTGILLAAGVFSGMITITASAPWLLDPAAFMYRHLRMSIAPFSLLLILYAFLVILIKRELASDTTDLARLSYLDRLLNCTIAAFFGIGVIWTAIGMESALVQALDGVKAGSSGAAAGLSAWNMLERLVNGGLLLALSTTVFGGACGYILRMLKIMLIGPAWDRFMIGEVRQDGHEQAADASAQ